MTTGNPNIEAVVEMLIIKAVDNDNKPIFDIGDKPILLREPVNVLMDVIGRMFTTVPNLEELEKTKNRFVTNEFTRFSRSVA